MNPTNEQELREQVSTAMYSTDYKHVIEEPDYFDKDAIDAVVGIIQAHTNAEIAKAKLEAFDVAFDCHDYDRLRAYRAELLKEVK